MSSFAPEQRIFNKHNKAPSGVYASVDLSATPKDQAPDVRIGSCKKDPNKSSQITTKYAQMLTSPVSPLGRFYKNEMNNDKGRLSTFHSDVENPYALSSQNTTLYYERPKSRKNSIGRDPRIKVMNEYNGANRYEERNDNENLNELMDECNRFLETTDLGFVPKHQEPPSPIKNQEVESLAQMVASKFQTNTHLLKFIEEKFGSIQDFVLNFKNGDRVDAFGIAQFINDLTEKAKKRKRNKKRRGSKKNKNDEKNISPIKSVAREPEQNSKEEKKEDFGKNFQNPKSAKSDLNTTPRLSAGESVNNNVFNLNESQIQNTDDQEQSSELSLNMKKNRRGSESDTFSNNDEIMKKNDNGTANLFKQGSSNTLGGKKNISKRGEDSILSDKERMRTTGTFPEKRDTDTDLQNALELADSSVEKTLESILESAKLDRKENYSKEDIINLVKGT